MNTDALHVSTRRLTSFQHGKDPTVHTSMHYGSFTEQKLHFCYMVIFIHDSFKLNVTTVERQARMKWTWMMMDANEVWVPCGVMSPWCDVMWWCHVSKWSTNHWQQCGNTEINNNRIQLSKKRQQEQKERTKPQAAFCLGPRESSFWSGLLQRLVGGGVFWGVGGVDKLARTFCCALCTFS